MKILLFNCKEYGANFESLSTRPVGLIPEKLKNKKQSCKECIVVFITVEKGDNLEKDCVNVAKEIIKMTKETKQLNVIIAPFAHLSNNLANSEYVLKALNLIENTIDHEVVVQRAHFGSHKSLLLDVHGHPGNIRYREF